MIKPTDFSMPLRNAYYQLNTHPVIPVNPTGTDDDTFGVLTLDLNEVKITPRPVFILFTVDTTGSMGEYATGSTTKIQYATQTLKSIVKYLSTQETDIYIQINTFNTEVHELIPHMKVTPQTVEQMLASLRTIDADGTTNIEVALKSASASINEYAEMNPTHSCVHIFMTDGEPNDGATTPTELINCITDDYLSINIGFGIDHNAKLLCEISNLQNSDYHFIDNVEKSHIVYGESLHKVLYPCLQNVNIHIENGYIYNWLTNEWTTSIHENTLIGDMNKSYHIKTNTPDSMSATVTGYYNNEDNTDMLYLEEEVNNLPELLDDNGNIIHDNTIINYAFRHCVLEVLFVATHTDKHANTEVLDIIKNRIRDLFRIIRIYTEENDLSNDKMIKQLMNDLYLAFWNIGNMEGEIYIRGRHCSQGNQHAYTPGNQIVHGNIGDDIDIPPRPLLRRSNHPSSPRLWDSSSSSNIFGLTDQLNIDILSDTSYDDTENEHSCYSTPAIRNTTSSILMLDED
jgi:Mg-chelatase subunit ChlD